MRPNPHPFPGYQIGEQDDAYIVTDTDREEHPELEGVIAIKILAVTHGRGIGAEPYGYLTTRSVKTIHLDEPCAACGCTIGERAFSQDRAGMVGSLRESCVGCDTEVRSELWD
jgi:hypothetical protein